MTVLSSLTRVSFVGNGVASSFPYTFPAQRIVDLRVTRGNVDGTETALVYGVDYTATVGETGGTVAFLGGAVLAVDATLVVERVVPIFQDTRLSDQGSFKSETHERTWDRVVMMARDLYNRFLRVPELGVTDEDGSGAYDFRGNRGENAAEPQNGNDVATRAWVEDLATALSSGGGLDLPGLWSGTGTGSQTVFPIVGATLASVRAYLVFVGGLYQRPTTDYTITLTPSPVVTLTVAPLNGVRVDVVSIGVARPVEELAVYTSITAPAASLSSPRAYLQQDPGGPMAYRVKVLNSDGVTYQYVTAAAGD